MQADGVGDAALVVLRRDDPNLSGEFARDPLENLEARRLNAVVISNKNTDPAQCCSNMKSVILYLSEAIRGRP